MGQLERLTVLITGANGFLGRHLIDSLRRSGARICAVARRVPGVIEGVQWHQGDVRSLEWLEGVIGATSPDVIYHLTSSSLGGQSPEFVLPNFEDDLRATVNTLLAARARGCGRVILMASMEELILDGRAVGFSSPYAIAKTCCTLYGHLFHQLYHLPVVILRAFMVYGPGQKHYKVIPYTTLSLLKGEAPQLSGGTRRVDWVYVEDIIGAMVEAAVKPDAVRTVIELGSGNLVSVREVVEQIHQLIPEAPSPKFGALPDRFCEVIRCAETQTARRILGWEATTPLAEGLARTVQYYARRSATHD